MTAEIRTGVTRLSPACSTMEHKGSARVAGRRVNVNTVTAQELEALPGIGPLLAGRNIASRPNRSVANLDRVPEIGPRRMEKIRPLVAVE